jgi:hypothetical protein
MNQYEDICAAYAKLRGAYEQDRKECLGFAQELVAGLAEELGCAPDDVVTLPPNMNYSPDLVRPVPQVLTHGADGAWHFGLGLRVRTGPDNPRTEIVMAQLTILRNPGGYEIYLGGTKESFRVPLEHEGFTKGHKAFVLILAKRAKRTYTDQQHRYSDGPDKHRPLR